MSFQRVDTTRSLAIAVTTRAIYRSSRERTFPRAAAKAYLPCLSQKESLHRNSEGMSENRCPASTDQVDSSDVIRARGGVHDLSRSVRSAGSVQITHLQMSTQHLPAYCRVSSAGKARYCGRPIQFGRRRCRSEDEPCSHKRSGNRGSDFSSGARSGSTVATYSVWQRREPPWTRALGRRHLRLPWHRGTHSGRANDWYGGVIEDSPPKSRCTRPGPLSLSWPPGTYVKEKLKAYLEHNAKAFRKHRNESK